MAKHFGYGATRGGGRLPRGKPMNIPETPSFASAFGLAMEVRRIAVELGMPASDVLSRMRKDGVVDCNDAAADAVLALVGQMKDR